MFTVQKQCYKVHNVHHILVGTPLCHRTQNASPLIALKLDCILRKNDTTTTTTCFKIQHQQQQYMYYSSAFTPRFRQQRELPDFRASAIDSSALNFRIGVHSNNSAFLTKRNRGRRVSDQVCQGQEHTFICRKNESGLTGGTRGRPH